MTQNLERAIVRGFVFFIRYFHHHFNAGFNFQDPSPSSASQTRPPNAKSSMCATQLPSSHVVLRAYLRHTAKQSALASARALTYPKCSLTKGTSCRFMIGSNMKRSFSPPLHRIEPCRRGGTRFPAHFKTGVPMNFTYFIPTKILFGSGSFNALAKEPLPGTKALVVITAGKSMRANGYLDRLLAMLDARGIGHVVFDRILPNPILTHVHEGAEIARTNGCDFIIGLGGGSSIDSAKSIAVMVKNPGNYWDYVFGGSGGRKPLSEPVLPVVAIATTAGTGTEADPWTVITKEDTNEKIGFGCNQTFPVLSIVDPELMLTIPPHLTAYQGFDALFHAIEGFIAKIATPLSDAYALKSIELLSKWLPIAVQDGSNIEAREQVATASTLAGMVESTSSCTSEHGMEHALSAYYPALPHGAGLIMLSEAYFTFFVDKYPELFTTLAKAMGVNVELLPEADRLLSFVKALMDLEERCGVRGLKMSDFGIKAEDMPRCAENARNTMGGLFKLDRYRLSPEETETIMRNAYK